MTWIGNQENIHRLKVLDWNPEYGYWYVGTQYKGLGVGRVIRQRDRIQFQLDYKNNVCNGDVNDRDCRRVFVRGNIPKCCVPAVLVFVGSGEFAVNGLNDQVVKRSEDHKFYQ